MRKNTLGISIEELDEVLDGNEPDVILPEEDTTPEAVDESTVDVVSEITDIKESTDAANSLQEQVDVVEEAGDQVTPVQLEELKLRFVKATLVTGIKPGKTKGKFSMEELNGTDLNSISTEGIKEFVMDLIEKIKVWLKTFWIKIKKWYLQLVIDMSNDSKKAAELEKRIDDLIASNPAIKIANKIDITKGYFLASTKDANTLYRKVSAMELLSGKSETISGLYEDFLKVDHIAGIRLKEGDFEGYKSIVTTGINGSKNGQDINYKAINTDIAPKLPKPIDPNNVYVTAFAPVGNRLSILMFNLSDGYANDIYYGKHHFTGLDGGEIVSSNYKNNGFTTSWDEDFVVIRTFGSGTISILTDIIKQSAKRAKETYEETKKEEDRTSKILNDLEKQLKENPEDKEISRKVKELRRIAMIQSEIIVDNFLAYRAVTKDMLYILGLGVKSAEKLDKETKKQ